MQRQLTDWGGNIAAFLLVLVVNVLSNALPINGQSMREISAKYHSLFTPAGFTFSIWGVIYLSLLVFVVYQALPSQRASETIARISRPFQVSCLANAAWLFAWHYDSINLSVGVMLILLASLVLIYRRLLDRLHTAPLHQHLALHLPFSLYAGWITLATLANISAAQTANGWDNAGVTAVTWSLVKISLAGAVGATVALRYGDAVFVLVVAWAAYGISVMQAPVPEVAGAATSLALLSLMLAARESASRLLAIRKEKGDIDG